jgi:chlorobactene glucosyltransferase
VTAQTLALGAVWLLASLNIVFALRSLQIAFGSTQSLRGTDPVDDGELPLLSIIVPARDEERQIEPCVRSLLALQYPHVEIIVVDDRSSDATAAIVEGIACEDARLHVVRGEPLPQGWVGKPWALAQGVRHARGEWLLFTDADTVHQPASAATAIAYARAHRLDVLSLLTEQHMETFAERAILPSILWTIAFAVGPLREINDPARSNAIFNGQYILARRAAYEAVGGHAAVRGEIAEDLELARRFKADGRFKTALIEADRFVRTRMYRSFAEIWNGFVKNVALGARDRPLQAALGIAFLTALSPLTPLALGATLVARDWPEALLLTAAALAAIASAAWGMRHFGLGAAAAGWLPLGLAVTVGIAATSVVRYAGPGVRWRGRLYRRGDFDGLDKSNSPYGDP